VRGDLPLALGRTNSPSGSATLNDGKSVEPLAAPSAGRRRELRAGRTCGAPSFMDEGMRAISFPFSQLRAEFDTFGPTRAGSEL